MKLAGRIRTRHVLGAILFATAFFYRFTLAEFDEAHLIRVARAMPILERDLPLEDLGATPSWLPVVASASVQRVAGESLFGEALMAAGILGAAAALTFCLALGVSRSLVIAAFATLLTIAVYPRFSAAWSILVYPAAVACVWRYVKAPGAIGMWLLVVATFLAYFTRASHGIAVSAAVIIAIAARHREDGLRTVRDTILVYAGSLATLSLVLIPIGEVPRHVRTVAADLSTALVSPLRAGGDWTAHGWRVNVLWAAGLPDESRTDLERRFQLTEPNRMSEHTWQYWLRDTTEANVMALIDDSNVIDTHGIDRQRFQPPRVRVLWLEGVDARTRLSLEQRFRLTNPVQAGERVWEYRLQDTSDQNIRALVNDRDADVLDITRIDQRAFEYPTINVRWFDDLPADARLILESRYSLIHPRSIDGRTWQYRLKDANERNVAALVNDSRVEDTQGIDRARFENVDRVTLLARDSLARARSGMSSVLMALPLDLSEAGTLFYPGTILILLVAGFLLIGRHSWSEAHPERQRLDRLRLLPLTIIGVSALLEVGPEDAQLKVVDTVPIFAILGCWIAQRLSQWSTAWGTAALLVASVGSAVLLAESLGRTPERLVEVGILAGPQVFWSHFAKTAERLRERPLDFWAPEGSTGVRALVRYVNDCTGPADRVLLAWREPEGAFFSGRQLHQAQRAFYGGSPRGDAEVVSALRANFVPIVLVKKDSLATFSRDYKQTHEYVMLKYRLAAESTFGGAEAIGVMVDPWRTSSGMHAELSLPCFK